METQIKVSFAQLNETKKKMSALSKKLESKTMNLTITNSKGSVAGALKESAKNMHEIKTALYHLTSVTEQVIENTRTSFKNVDSGLAKILFPMIDNVWEGEN